ncbi:hypothetical protein LRQ11_23370 [Pseudomonas sp. MAFF 311095]|uniref:Secreted protein n=1 Tax=Pseudomonas petroselini TaxID=2899822 RepID=A0ABS8QVI3_9PSED|nr:hypothetical protein [Pseudomonas petroselini]MCD7039695.1 hypothetical protein [Pseudomonas petroselini]MCD7043345.1 hypothetical protein [Pseudomonas petroselini]MCD7067142.1 hypothetical protein [Pseudomonas petroselini]MCD7081583.1 hypothetical protein [Pseudomonas petroselini]
MTVFLLLYLCADATRTNCQVLQAQHWNGTDAYEQCIGTIPALSKALTAPNRKRHRFVCEIQSDGAQPAEQKSPPTSAHQSFRM